MTLTGHHEGELVLLVTAGNATSLDRTTMEESTHRWRSIIYNTYSSKFKVALYFASKCIMMELVKTYPQYIKYICSIENKINCRDIGKY